MAPATAAQVEAALEWPVVVKPSKQGSTVGLTVVREPSALEAAVAEAFLYDDEVMIERFVPGRELTVSVLGDVPLPVGEIKPKHEIYDYECKYTSGMAVEEFPADLTPEQTLEVQAMALAAFRALKLEGYARVDFRMTAAGHFACLEANTLPGMTALSLLPQAAQAAGIGFADPANGSCSSRWRSGGGGGPGTRGQGSGVRGQGSGCAKRNRARARPNDAVIGVRGRDHSSGDVAGP
jgi:D-alanine-D-alanine ligase